MSGWWFAAGCVGLFLTLWAFASRRWKRQALILKARRSNPTHEQFIALLVEDCDQDIAEFAWKIFAEDYSGWGVELNEEAFRHYPPKEDTHRCWEDTRRSTESNLRCPKSRWRDQACLRAEG